MLLNLDPNFTPYGPGVDFKSWMFSGGEVGVKLGVNLSYRVIITCRLINSDRIMELLMVTDALRRIGTKEISVVIPYIPYARQDRVMVKGESLSLKVFANLINSQNYTEIRCLDAHSDVTTALLNNVVNVSNHKFVYRVLSHHKGSVGDDFWLCSPDAGSLKKIYGVAKVIGYHKYGIIKCDKERYDREKAKKDELAEKVLYEKLKKKFGENSQT